MEYLLFQVLLEAGQLKNQRQNKRPVRIPAKRETLVFALSPFYATAVDTRFTVF